MKKRNKFLHFTLILFLSFLIFADSSLGKTDADEREYKPLTKKDIFENLELFADAITLINANYVEDVKPQQMIYGALEGMLSSLDSHSSFLTPEEFKEIQTETRGEFGGIGIKVTLEDKILTVVSPLEGTPAYKAGILPGDKIIKINNESTKDFSLDDAVKILRGRPGTKVGLTIMREKEDRLREFSVIRAMIKIKSVKNALMLEDGFGYIRVVEFQRYTALDLDKAIRRLLKGNMQGLILDLRNNPGGLLDAAVSVSEKFLKKGDSIVSTKSRIEKQNMVFKSKTIRPFLNFPVVVMVNKGSASASEIVAGALRDNKRALVLGEATFGKGSVQTVIPMRDGSALRLTTSLYYTPSGNVIHKKGVIPDVEVKYLPPEVDEEDIDIKRPEKELAVERLRQDNQVEAALDLLRDEQRYVSIINS